MNEERLARQTGPQPVSCTSLEAGRLAARTADIEPFRVVEVLERAWAAEAAGRDVVHLEVGEPDFGTPAPVVEAVTAAIAGGRVHYTSSLGLPALREAIAATYGDRLGVEVPARRVVVTTGASGAILLALAATVGRDDEVLLSDPGYPCNRNLLRVVEGRPVPVPVGPDTAYQLRAAHLDERWTRQTRGVLLASPSNPTGTVVPPGELAAIAAGAHDRGGVCFVDEIYGELVYDTDPVTVLGADGSAFVVNSFSKTFGMTGWRVGWLVCPDWALRAVEALAQNLYISPPVPAQHGALAALTPEVWAVVEERRRIFAARRDLLVDGLRRLGFTVAVTPAGAFYVYAGCEAFGRSDAVATRLLDEAGVAVTPGCDFGTHRADGHLRFSYTTSAERITLGLERIAAWVRPACVQH